MQVLPLHHTQNLLNNSAGSCQILGSHPYNLHKVLPPLSADLPMLHKSHIPQTVCHKPSMSANYEVEFFVKNETMVPGMLNIMTAFNINHRVNDVELDHSSRTQRHRTIVKGCV